MKKHSAMCSILALLAILYGVLTYAYAGQVESAPYTVNIWVEKPNIERNPGNPVTDPYIIDNFMVYHTEIRWAPIGSSISLGRGEGDYLYTVSGRRFAHYVSSDKARVEADGSTVINAYYARGIFTYVFDIGNTQAEMAPDGELFTGGSNKKYTIMAKYEQSIVFPGLTNGLMPVNLNKAVPDAVCVGWALDERTGVKDILPYTDMVIDSMLPGDGMPYNGLVFNLKGVWYNNVQIVKTICWYEQLPDEMDSDDSESINRIALNGRIYINYPATDYYFALPKGTTPVVGDADGLTLVKTIQPKSDDDVSWQFIYDRKEYTLTLYANEAEDPTIIGGTGIKYQQNLIDFDPGWNEGTILTVNGKTYLFYGWYTQENSFLAYNLGDAWMPSHDLVLFAMWIEADIF